MKHINCTISKKKDSVRVIQLKYDGIADKNPTAIAAFNLAATANHLAQALFTQRLSSENAYPYRFYESQTGLVAKRSFMAMRGEDLFYDANCTHTGYTGNAISAFKLHAGVLLEALEKDGDVEAGAMIQRVELSTTITKGRNAPTMLRCSIGIIE